MLSLSFQTLTFELAAPQTLSDFACLCSKHVGVNRNAVFGSITFINLINIYMSSIIKLRIMGRILFTLASSINGWLFNYHIAMPIIFDSLFIVIYLLISLFLFHVSYLDPFLYRIYPISSYYCYDPFPLYASRYFCLNCVSLYSLLFPSIVLPSFDLLYCPFCLSDLYPVYLSIVYLSIVYLYRAYRDRAYPSRRVYFLVCVVFISPISSPDYIYPAYLFY